jgi:hypothetical protein
MNKIGDSYLPCITMAHCPQVKFRSQGHHWYLYLYSCILHVVQACLNASVVNLSFCCIIIVTHYVMCRPRQYRTRANMDMTHHQWSDSTSTSLSSILPKLKCDNYKWAPDVALSSPMLGDIIHGRVKYETFCRSNYIIDVVSYCFLYYILNMMLMSCPNALHIPSRLFLEIIPSDHPNVMWYSIYNKSLLVVNVIPTQKHTCMHWHLDLCI